MENLVEMGYEPKVISLALEESTNKTLEEVLDLLLFREGHYKKLLQKKQEKGILPKLNKKYSLDDQLVEPREPIDFKSKKEQKSKGGKSKARRFTEEAISDDDWLDEDLIDNIPQSEEVYELKFGQAPKKVVIGKPKEEKEVKENEANVLKDVLPESINEEESQYLKGINEDLMNINSKDPNEYINRLSDHIEAIMFKSGGVNKKIKTYITLHARFMEIIEFKNQVYAILTKALTMKLRKRFAPDVKKIESLLLTAFQLQLMSPKQMENVLNSYVAFCKKLNVPEEIHLVNKLEKCIEGFGKPIRPNSPVKKPEEEKRQDDEKIPVNDDSVAKEVNEEDQNGDEATEDLPVRPIYGHVAVSDCVICMEKTREIVFLPCSHFLTCPLCSPRVIKCPMCNRRIEKHLKIQWS